MVKRAFQDGLATVTLRPKAVFGPGDTSLLPRILDAAAAGRLPQIGHGNNRIDLTYVDNVIHAILLSLSSESTHSLPQRTKGVKGKRPVKGSRLTLVSHWARLRWRLLRGETLIRYQDWMAQRIVEYAQRHSPYYRDHFSGYDARSWQSLPTSDKAAMMAHFDQFNTREVTRAEALEIALQAERTRDFSPVLRGLTVGLSSGISGRRGLFLVNPWEQAGWAGAILARTLPPFRREGYRVALFHRSNSNLYEQLDSRWLELRYYDLMIPQEEAITSLNGYKPDVLVGPPSLLLLLSAARRGGKLRIQPSRIYSAAEVLEEQDRAAIETAFDVPVRQIYQCTEGLLAVTCDSLSLHIQEDLVAIQTEPLPGKPDEQRVTPIVTDLWRRVQPIIRYRLNDVLKLSSSPCACGSDFRVITRIEGRCDDVLYFEAKGGSLRPFSPDTIRRIILLSSGAIADYRAVQDRPGHLRINLEVAPGVEFGSVAESVRRSVEETMQRYDCYCVALPSPAGTRERRIVW